jgi:hypothetical protein
VTSAEPNGHLEPSGDVDEIVMTLPAAARFARVARLALTGLASRIGFTYDDVEDVRIAVGELFGILVDGAPPDGRIQVRCRMDGDRLDIEAEALPPRPLAAVGQLSRQILAAVTTEVAIDETRGRITCTASMDVRG